MDLEQRVQALEQELEILKNQIQTTLLEIQEQLSTKAYPSLRAEDMPQRNNNAGLSTGRPVRQQIPSHDADPTTDEEPEPVSRVRKVALNEVAPDEPPQQATRRPAPKQPADINEWSSFDEMERWVSEKVREIGPGRTRKLIEMQFENGSFSMEMTETLLQFVRLYDEDAIQPHPQMPARKPATPVVRKAAPSVVQPQAAKPAPKPPPQATRQRPPEASRQQPPAKPAQTPSPEPKARSEARDDANVVLRLIAGVQNAGAGVKWRKHSG